MYIRKSIRKYGDKRYTNHLLVESIQTPKGPRQKTICSLGDLSPRPAKDWLKLAHKIEDALLGQEGLIAEADTETSRLIINTPCGLCHSSKFLSFRLVRNLSGRIPDALRLRE